jgi:hypothetical protein
MPVFTRGGPFLARAASIEKKGVGSARLRLWFGYLTSVERR